MKTKALIQRLRSIMPLGPLTEEIHRAAADRLEELQRERDEARAEVERLKQELTEAIRERNKTVADLVKQCDEERAYNEFTFAHRPEPSRLEIAAIAMQGFIASSGFIIDIPKISLEYANALIAAAKEGK